MNHLTLYGYEEDGELFVWRCPVCGSTGPIGTCCLHDAPMVDGYKGGDAVSRKLVRVPGVGEEPRPDVDAFALQAYGEDVDGFQDIYLKDWAALLLAMESDGWRILHFTHGESVAEGGSVQCDGVALAQLVEAAAGALWNEREFRDPTGDEPEGWCPPGHDVHQEPPREPFLWEQMVAEGKYEGSQEETRADARAVINALLVLTQQSSGGQEGGVEEGHRWVLVSDEDENETKVCTRCGAQRDMHGALAVRAKISGGWPSQIDCDLIRLVIDPEAAVEGLSDEDRKYYEECRKSIVDARLAAPLNEGKNVIASTQPISDYKSGEGR
jgi:hypothetical protein